MDEPAALDGSRTTNEDEELSAAERAALAAASVDRHPPAHLEARILAALRAEGLLRSPARAWLRRAAVAALVAVAFGAGATWQRVDRSHRDITHGPRCLLLL